MAESMEHVKVREYVARLEGGLIGLPREHVREILEEFRGHISDRLAMAAGDADFEVDRVLGELGSADKLAALYVSDALLARAEASSSQLTFIQHVWRWARVSVRGALLLLALVIGYTLAAGFLIAAAVKPFAPQAGLWLVGPDSISLHLGLGPASVEGRAAATFVEGAGAQDLLGWWIIPLGLALGVLVGYLTNLFGKATVRWMRNASRKPSESIKLLAI